MSDHLSIVVNIAYAISALILVGFAVLFVMRLRTVRADRRRSKYLAKHRDYFSYLAAHLDGDAELGVPYGSLKPAELEVIRDKLFEWIEQIRGQDRAKLTDLCRRLGIVERELARLDSSAYWNKMDAVHHLGIMRCAEAVPRLFKLLEEEPYGSSLFVIARSIARCARDLSELRRMVLQLVKHRKGCHQLIADILADSSLDYTPLLTEFLREGDEDLVNIALLALRQYENPWTPGADEAAPADGKDAFRRQSDTAGNVAAGGDRREAVMPAELIPHVVSGQRRLPGPEYAQKGENDA